jgi:hypothetical protein
MVYALNAGPRFLPALRLDQAYFHGEIVAVPQSLPA